MTDKIELVTIAARVADLAVGNGDLDEAEKRDAIVRDLRALARRGHAVPEGCYVIRHNADGEFGQRVGWLYRTGGDLCVISGRPVYVWRPLAELLREAE